MDNRCPLIQSDEIAIRRTTTSDLDFVMATEHADENKILYCSMGPFAARTCPE